MNCALCSDVKGGALPCDKVKMTTRSRCPDDKIMVNKKYFQQNGVIGRGGCIGLTHRFSLHGIATTTWKFPILGKKSLVITKAWVTHPHGASKPVGVFLFKRLVTHTCTGENPAFCTKGVTVADVHKVGYCVKCVEERKRKGKTYYKDFNVFPETWASAANSAHRKSFVNDCLPKAIDKKGNIRRAFECTDPEDLKMAVASISAF